MTAKEFRAMALQFPDAVEGSHMNHPDVRVSGKIFATLGYPTRGWGMVKLSREEQSRFIAMDHEAFMPARGAWGRQGATIVRLRAVTREMLRKALRAAWASTAQKRPAQRASDRSR